MKQLSIVIITLNEAKCIATLLSDLSQQTFRHFEVIVVDSNSEDNTCEIAQTFSSSLPNLTVHRMQDRGVSLGRNTGAQLARFPHLLFLDADVRLSTDFLDKATTQLRQKKLSVAGVFMGAKGLPLHYKMGYGLFNIGLFLTQFSFPTAVGACIFSSQQIHQNIGGFNESIQLCEDCDYVKRASRVTKFRFLSLTFQFDPRRLQQDGFFRTGWLYLRANIYRFFVGEICNNEIPYQFGHYEKNAKQ